MLVKGVVASIGTSSGPDGIVVRMTLMDPGASSSATEFAVAWGAADPLLGFPRHLPLIGRLAPQPRVSRWGPLANYRVQLRAAPGGSCGFLPCYEALLLDAAPQAGFRLGLM